MSAPSGVKSTAPIRSVKWKSKLILNEDKTAKALFANAVTALRHAPEFQGVLAFDEFTLNVVALKPPPWGESPGAWTDHEDHLTANWLQHNGIYVRPEVAGEAVQVVAKDQPMHPVREYLDSLKWDATKRVDSWLSLYLGAKPTDYTEAVGTRWLVSAVARIFKPGAKVDCCIILEGPQGIGKSRSLRTLAGPWFTDELADLGSKDAAMQTQGVWIVEIAEMDTMNRSEASRIKAFMSRSFDRFRPPYGRRLIQSPRQCVFAGSVNHSTYLKDETGGRRFWPVACTRIRLTQLERDRDQLWAEAVSRYRSHQAWWIDSMELSRLAEEEQKARFEADPWESKITEFISNEADVSVSGILEHCLGKKTDQWSQSDQTRVAKCLTSCGWIKYRGGPRDARIWRYRPQQLTLGI